MEKEGTTMKPDCWICSKCPYRSISNPKINHTFALLDVPCTGPIIPMYSRESLVSILNERIRESESFLLRCQNEQFDEADISFNRGIIHELKQIRAELTAGEEKE